VLLGEASHGTHEFYRERAEITKRLIEEKGFTAVAVEADWPDAYRVNRYVRGAGDDADASRRSAASALPDLDVAQRRRARLRRVAARAQRRAAGAQRPASTARPLQPARLDGGGARLPRQGGPRGGQARARALRLLRPLRRGHPGLRLRRQLRPGQVVRGRGRRQLVELQRRAAEYARATAGSPRTSSSTPSRTRGWSERRGVLPLDVPRPRLVVEPARPPHGRDARALVAHLDRQAGARRSSSGRTTRTSATRAPPRWASAAS
jgi:hypothetical protein